MLQKKKIPNSGILLAGLAAFAYYKYSRMSEEQKRNFINDLREKGKKYYDQYVPEEVRNIFSQKTQMIDSIMPEAENITT